MVQSAWRWLLLLVSVPLLGCGGGLSQADMRRHAIKRSSDDSDERSESPETAPAQHKPAAGSPNTGQDADASSAANSRAEIPAQTLTGRSLSENADRRVLNPVLSSAASASEEQASTVDIASGPTHTRPPPQALTLEQRRGRTIDNLTKIGKALQRYVAQKRFLPAAATYSPGGRPLLSWRVTLLPYLGYGELYKKFRVAEPWDSPHNLALLESMPPEYQSPERFDTKTNYVVPVATYTPFYTRQGLPLRQLEDGLANTIAVLEADDSEAVPWTKPADLKLDLEVFIRRVGELRQDGTFVVWGDGSMGCVPPQPTAKSYRAMFSYDGGEPFTAASVQVTAVAALAPQASPTSAKSATELPSTVSHGAGKPHPESPRGPAEPEDAPARARQRLPVPKPDSLDQARELVRELYEPEYRAARTPGELRVLTGKLFKQAQGMPDDPPGQYALLEVVGKMATRLGDSATAISAASQLAATFEIDELDAKMPTLNALVKSDHTRSGVGVLLRESQSLVELALRKDDFSAADNLRQIALTAARKLKDRAAQARLEPLGRRIETARAAYGAMQRALGTLADRESPQANVAVGTYYCLVKGEWERGLPLLARGDDAELKELAEQELHNPTVPIDQLRLADAWWKRSDTDDSQRRALRMRAACWYARAAKALPNGLFRVKAETRLEQVKRAYGPAALQAALLASATDSAARFVPDM